MTEPQRRPVPGRTSDDAVGAALDLHAACAPSPSRRAADTLAKKRRLLDVARDQFIEQGYRATTMETIAQAAGISKRSLYLWHRDKAALFRACVIAGAQRFPSPALGPHRDMDQSLRDFGMALLDEFMRPSTLGMGKLILKEADDFPELARLSEMGTEDYLVTPLAAHLRRGALADADAEHQARLLIAMLLAPIHDHLLTRTTLPGHADLGVHVARAVNRFLKGGHCG